MRYKLQDRWILTDERKKYLLALWSVTWKILLSIFISFLICWSFYSLTTYKPPQYHNYYKVKYDCFPPGRTDTIHRVLYTKYGKLQIYQESSGKKIYLISKEHHIVKTEFCPVKIINQTPITKEEYDSI